MWRSEQVFKSENFKNKKNHAAREKNSASG